MTEIKREVVEDTGLDWTRAGADFYEAWLNMGRGIKGAKRVEGRSYPVDEHRHNGARILSRGYVFMAAVEWTTYKYQNFNALLKTAPHLEPIKNNVENTYLRI